MLIESLSVSCIVLRQVGVEEHCTFNSSINTAMGKRGSFCPWSSISYTIAYADMHGPKDRVRWCVGAFGYLLVGRCRCVAGG